jgi:hypothetical protein
MKTRVIQQFPPDHWAPEGETHWPKRCVICWVRRIGVRLGIIEWEYE